MRKIRHTTGDLIEVYSDLLHYVRIDAETHRDFGDHDEECDGCSVQLYERGQAIYDDFKLWKLLRAAPKLLERCRMSRHDARDALNGHWEPEHEGWQSIIDDLTAVIAEATGE